MIDFLESVKAKLNAQANYQQAIDAGYKPLDKATFSRYNHFRPRGAKQLFCYLPFNSLTFSFGGKVHVCSYNRDVVLGNYPENSIKDIWEGAKAEKLRRHMRHNDLEYGCRHCKFFFEKDKFSNLRPLVFDKYYRHTNADFPRVFEFELDNKCNLECQMCNGEVSSSIRKNRDKLPPIRSPYDDKFVAQLAAYIPHLKEAKFYGGEPFMIPIYYKIWNLIEQLNPSLDLFVITNGTLWNNNIEHLVNHLNFDIAVSIDGTNKSILEKIRKNVEKEVLLENIKKFSAVCRKKKKYLSLSFTIQQDNWMELPKHIDLCNQMEAFAYISYLENPKHFSILEFPKIKIERIRKFLDDFTFPTTTPKEKHNVQCYQDFKKYLDAYLNNQAETRYNDYEFQPEWSAEQDREILLMDNQIKISKYAQKELFLQHCATYLELNQQSEKYSMIAEKLHLIMQPFNTDEQGKIFAVMLQGDISHTIASIEVENLDHLQNSVRDTLPYIVLEK